MSAGTPCPDGKSWCTSHETRESEHDEGTFTIHAGWLFSRFAPAQPAVPSTSLLLSDYSTSSGGPGLSLRQFFNPPQTVEPEEARRLAAALLRGAEIVEAARTATCPRCDRAVTPAELSEVDDEGTFRAGLCGQCSFDLYRAERDARRDTFKVVR